MKNKLSNIILFLILIAGLSLLLYPTVADYWNSFHQTQAIGSYSDAVANMEEQDYERMLSEAQEYNASQAAKGTSFLPLEEKELVRYNSILNVTDSGIMGYIDIPGIRCKLPIYHGTNDDVLAIAIGHLEWSSLPVGGSSTHTVLSGHRGLPSAKLFTNLDKVVVGDVFFLNVLGDTLAYEVDQIHIVLPEEMSMLSIEEGKDLCTLVTCTPYGINSHRLLVRGHRVDYYNVVRVAVDAMQIDTAIVAVFIAAAILFVILPIFLVKTRKATQRKRDVLKSP